ncbi:hypothetical protein ACQP25_44495 (plasmid) [Microtetraspora malaysiensis]
MVSVVAAERKLDKPLDVDRPEWFRPKKKGVEHAIDVVMSSLSVIT